MFRPIQIGVQDQVKKFQEMLESEVEENYNLNRIMTA